MASLIAIRRASFTISSLKVNTYLHSHVTIFNQKLLSTFTASNKQNFYTHNPNHMHNFNPQNYPSHQNFYPHNSIHCQSLPSVCGEGKLKEAVELMQKGEDANADCFSLLFGLCGKLKKLEEAKKMHDYFLRSNYRGDVGLVHQVIDMYCKCGSMVDAHRVFNHMNDKNMDSWHLVINGYAENGLGYDGLEMYEKMRNLGLRPNEETFVAVLEACAAADAVEEGFKHLDAMKNEYGIVPKMEHYLGVFGKPGHLVQALEYVEKLPFEPTMGGFNDTTT